MDRMGVVARDTTGAEPCRRPSMCVDRTLYCLLYTYLDTKTYLKMHLVPMWRDVRTFWNMDHVV